MTKYLAHIAVVIALLPIAAFSQGNGDPQQSTTIDTKANRYIRPAYRVSESPKMLDTVVSIPAQEYPMVFHQMDVYTETEPIEPAKLKIVDPISKIYRGYVKAGIGMYTSPLLDIHFMETRSRGGSWGVNFKHFSSRDAFSNLPFSGFSDNNAMLYGKKFLKNHILSANLKFDHLSRYQYGIKPDNNVPFPDTAYDREDIRQRFSNYEVNAQLKRYFEDTLKLNQNYYLDYYYFQDYRDDEDKRKFDFAREHRFKIGTELSSYFNNEFIRGMFELDYANYKADTINPCAFCDTNTVLNSNGNAIANLGFQITTRGKFWSVKGGVKVGINMPDRGTSNAGFHLYPDVEARLSLFDNIFIPYVGLTGGLERNSFRSLARENPFVLSALELRNTNNVWKAYGGFRGSLSSKASFNLGVSTGQYRNVPLFWRDTTFSYNNRFDVIYDTLTITSFFGQISVHYEEEIKVFAKGEYFIYSGSQLYPWYRPTYQFSLNGIYDLADKIIGRLDVYVLGGRRAGSSVPVDDIQAQNGIYVVDLGGFVDINLGFEYRYTKRLSGYVNFNNILSRKYQLYQDYPLQGINIHGGITYSF